MVFNCITIDETSKSTISLLNFEGEFICFVLEDGYREKKVFGETRIPPGCRQIQPYRQGKFHARYRSRFNHDMVFLMTGVPQFTYIIPHIGNFITDTDGCPLLCTGIDKNQSGHYIGLQSTKAYLRFYQVARPLITETSLYWNTIR